MNTLALFMSAVSVFAASALHLDLGTADLGFGLTPFELDTLKTHGAVTGFDGVLVKGVHHGAHVVHFLPHATVAVEGLKFDALFAWDVPAGKVLKEVLLFHHLKHTGLFLLHVLFTDGTTLFFHLKGGFLLPLEHHLWLAKLAKGTCKHAPALVGLPHHALLVDLAKVWV